MRFRSGFATALLAAFVVVIGLLAGPSRAQEKKPNIVIIWGDDVG